MSFDNLDPVLMWTGIGLIIFMLFIAWFAQGD